VATGPSVDLRIEKLFIRHL